MDTQPDTRPDSRGPSGRRGSPLLAIATGWLVDIAGTTVFASLALTLVAMFIGGGPEGERALAAFERSGTWQGFGLIFGMAFTALGGFLAARIANHAEYRIAGCMGLASLAAGEYLMQAADGLDGSTFWVRLVGLLCTVPAALGGAWLYRQGKRAGAPTANG